MASRSRSAAASRALLALLALNAGQAVSMEQLVDELWGDAVPETAQKMVKIYISQLRKVLPRSEIETRSRVPARSRPGGRRFAPVRAPAR